MARTYDIRDLITLPRLDASSADALVTEVLTCAKGKSMAAPIESARKNLIEAQKALKGALMSRLQAVSATDSARAREADKAEDAAFSATFDWLTGFSKLPDTYEEVVVAERLLVALFRDGLKFTQLAYKLEWAEADARLRAIAEDRALEDGFEKLGGEIFLKNLRKAHKEYGDALGITTPKGAEVPAVAVKEPLTAVRTALRTYVLRVLAHGEDDPALAETLLAPLAAWEAPNALRGTKGAPKPVTPGDASPSPDA
jgi:hypothetical protein